MNSVRKISENLTSDLDFFTLTFVGTEMAEGAFDVATMLADASEEAIKAEKAYNLSTVLAVIGLKGQPVIASLDDTGLIVKVAIEHASAWKDAADLEAAFEGVKLFDAAGNGNKIDADVTAVKAEML